MKKQYWLPRTTEEKPATKSPRPASVPWAVLGLSILFGPVDAQSFAFHAGVSSSWGHKNTIICTLRCSPGYLSSHENWVTPTVGVSMVGHPIIPLQLETGAALVAKGWSVTTPNLRRLYLEIPLLAHLGYWPQGAGMGLGVTGGVAADLFAPIVGESDVAWIGGVRFLISLPSQHRFTLSVRYTRGLTSPSRTLENRSMTYLVGFAPRW